MKSMECGPSFCILFLAAIGLSTSFVVNVDNDDIDHESYRLPSQIVPVSYDLWIFTRLGYSDFKYHGRVNITLKVLQATNVVVVHNDGLLVRKENSLLYRGVGEVNNSAVVSITGQSYDTVRQFYSLRCSSKLEVGTYTLVLYFDGEIQDDVFGFYRSSYIGDRGTKWIGITQFSPTYARRAFPCMDEPHLKATFTIHIGHTENQMATSNTEPESTLKHSNSTNYYITTFSPTPKMSTYLVGWSVHDFVPETSSFSDKFKIWTRESMNRRGSTSLNQGLSVYNFLSEYLLVENPVSKMDEIAVADFNFNAMENWGMITFRESVVLHDGGVTPTRKMLDGFTTMAHELAHTWFGNLVTPRFWDVVWLKEGFASYFQYFALSRVRPTWGMMDKFVVDVLQPTLLADSENHTRTMNGRNVGDPASIMAALDFVSYKKGASVIRMLSHVIGEAAFQKGLQSYLKNMSFEAASPSDLYEHLQASVDQLQDDLIVKDIMESWTNNPGFPLVTVLRDYNNSMVVISQQPFLNNRSSSNKWWIPINFVTKSANNFSLAAAKYWLKPEIDRLTLFNVISPNDWIILNAQQVGYYRVNYDVENWRMLIDFLKSKDYRQIHKVNRAQLIDDAFNLARAGHLDYLIALDLAGYLIQETDYEPWQAAVNNFRFLNKMLTALPDVQPYFQEYVSRLLRATYERLSFNEYLNEDFATKLCREPVLSTSCLLRAPHCLNASKILFQNWITSPDKSRIPKDVKSFVYCEGVRAGNDEVWYKLFNRWKSTDLQNEQELLLRALSCTRNNYLISRYVQLSFLMEHGLRKQYRIAIVQSVLEERPENVELVLQIVGKNLRTIIDRRGYDFLRKTITAIGNAITTQEQAIQLRLFVEEHREELGSALNSAKQAIVKASETIEWIRHFLPNIAGYFSTSHANLQKSME